MNISKKRLLVWCSAFIVVFLILIVMMCISQSSEDPENTTIQSTEFYNITSMEGRNTYVFSPQSIKYFFTPTAEEFFSTNYSWYNSCEDFRKYAGIDENGNLILHLTKEREEAHLQTYNSAVESFKNTHGVDVAEDYSSFTITGTEEEVSHILYYHMSVYFMIELKFTQLYSGKSPKMITITANFVNKETGETVYSATWPQENIEIDYDDPFP